MRLIVLTLIGFIIPGGWSALSINRPENLGQFNPATTEGFSITADELLPGIIVLVIFSKAGVKSSCVFSRESVSFLIILLDALFKKSTISFFFEIGILFSPKTLSLNMVVCVMISAFVYPLRSSNIFSNSLIV